MDEPKQRTRRAKSKRETKPRKEISLEKIGIIVAVVGIVLPSIFSAVQSCQANEQLRQGQIAIAQTQEGLKETRKQNQLAIEQLKLAEEQFRYSRKQDSIKDFHDSLDAIEKNKQFEKNLALLSTQTKALSQSNEVDIASRSPDVRVILKEDTVVYKHFHRLGVYFTYRDMVQIYIQNIGERTAQISTPEIYVIHPYDSAFQARYGGFGLSGGLLKDLGVNKKLRILPLKFKLSLDFLPSKPTFDNQPRLLVRVPLSPNAYDGDHYHYKNYYDKGEISFIMIILNVKDYYTNQSERKYYSFDLVREEKSFNYKITPMPLARQSELIDIIRNTK